METGHTATPYEVRPTPAYDAVYSEDGVLICFAAMSEKARKNAKFIVRACNNFDPLVEALQALVDNGGIGPESMFDDARAALLNAKR